ncbi:MAG: hypothetical protein FJ284_09760 [Planctomycetes bacterium]|nr:hypothetical protein [Planctomycetota bacterium]
MAYAAVTDFLGFRPLDDEWPVMGMAAYGAPCYREECSRLIRVEGDFEALPGNALGRAFSPDSRRDQGGTHAGLWAVVAT